MIMINKDQFVTRRWIRMPNDVLYMCVVVTNVPEEPAKNLVVDCEPMKLEVGE
jgi:hypothetical protein